MPLSAQEVFDRLSVWPHRRLGSDEEMEARETLITLLSAEPDLEMTEEGFEAPASNVPYMLTLYSLSALAILIAKGEPLVAWLLGAAVLAGFLLLSAARHAPLLIFGGLKTTANLVATKGAGRRLVLITAHLDSPPHSFFDRPGISGYADRLWWGQVGVLALGLIVAFLAGFGLTLPFWLQLALAGAVLIAAIVTCFDELWYGHDQGLHDNASGVAAAVAAASQLWRHMPHDCEVRLVVTTGGALGHTGAQHYRASHVAELKNRPVQVIAFDRVGLETLCYWQDHTDGEIEALAGIAAGQQGNRAAAATVFAQTGLPCLTFSSMQIAGGHVRAGRQPVTISTAVHAAERAAALMMNSNVQEEAP